MRLEDPAKKSVFFDLLTKIDTKTEMFNASKNVMVQRVKELYGICAHVIADTFVDPELGLGPSIDCPLFVADAMVTSRTMATATSPMAPKRSARGEYDTVDDDVDVSSNDMDIEHSCRDERHLDRLEVSKRVYYVEDTKRVIEDTKREVEREVTKRELLELKKAMVLKGYSVADIDRLCTPH